MTQALALGQACGSKVYVLQVVEIVPEFEAVAPDLRTCLEEECRRQKVVTASEAALKGVQLDYRVLHSVSPFAAIVEEADKIQPNLILMGRYGRTALLRLAMGSVTHRVIGLSPFNVLVVPRDASLAFQRLLIASDGSQFSARRPNGGLSPWRAGPTAELFGVAVAREEGEILEAQEIVARHADRGQPGRGLLPGLLAPGAGRRRRHHPGGPGKPRRPHRHGQPWPHRLPAAAPGQRHRAGHRPGPLPGPGGEEEIVILFSVFCGKS